MNSDIEFVVLGMKSRIFSLLILICLGYQCSKAQDQSFLQKHPIMITVYNHSVSMPFKNIFKWPINAGISVGTLFAYNQDRRFSQLQSVELGWFFHRHLGKQLFVKTNLINRFTTKSGLWGDVQVGLGYLHSFYAKEVFELDRQGNYRSVGDTGYPGIIGGFGLGMGYTIQSSGNRQFSPYIKYEWMAQYPYSDFTPIFPHSFVHLGSMLQFN